MGVSTVFPSSTWTYAASSPRERSIIIVMGTEQPQEGDQVSWKWGAGHPQETVAETKSSGDLSIQTQAGNTVKKYADEDNPAVRISPSSRQDVVKRASALHVAKKANLSESTHDGANKNEDQTTTTKTLKRKEQASIYEKEPKKSKNVRTGKEGEEIASDHEDGDEEAGDQEEDGDADPEMTEEEGDEDIEEDELAEKPTEKDTRRSTGGKDHTKSSGKGKDPEPKKGSINALLNETDSHSHHHPPTREAKEVAERKIAETGVGGATTSEGLNGNADGAAGGGSWHG